MTFWTLSRVADALEALAPGNLPRGDAPLTRVWTDTRTIAPGDCFVALVGDRFDAHDFLADAVARGASALVVSRVAAAAGLGVPVFAVRDTLVGLGALGRHRRRAWGAQGRPVIGVVGTNGKTSTKELLRAALGSRLETHATTGNLNNLVGVPLTLLAIPDGAEAAVIEMGTNQPGEVARLRAIVEADVTVVTSIAEEHLEGLGDLAGVMREEMAACDAAPLAVVPAAQPEVVEEARRRAGRTVAAGLELAAGAAEADDDALRADAWGLDDEGRGWLSVQGIEVRLPLRGVHNLRNATLALAVARELGVALDDAARGMAEMPVPPMRSNWEHLGRATLINDAYNANPGSARAALEMLRHAGTAAGTAAGRSGDGATTGTGRQKVAVLGSMLELGPSGPALHDALAREALAGENGGKLDVVAGVGEFAKALERVAPGDPRVVTAPDADQLWARLASRLAPDAVILLKGSRGVRLERLVPSITEWATRASGS